MEYRVLINGNQHGPYKTLDECFYLIDEAYKEVERDYGVISWAVEAPEGVYDGSNVSEGIWVSIAEDAKAFKLYLNSLHVCKVL